MKRIVYACIDQMLRFDDRAECDEFISKLGKGKNPKKFKLRISRKMKTDLYL